MFDILLDKQPQKFLHTCETDLFNRLVVKLNDLKVNPALHDSKRLVGYSEPAFRIRVGKYRILYRINYADKKVIIVKIDNRERVYE